MARPKKIHNPIEELLNPSHISRRCGAKARSTGEPCKNFALIGGTRCKFHGGASKGRPKTHGKRSASYIRERVIAKALIRLLHEIHGHEIPTPI